MCTVTWTWQPSGYVLFCNRDEKRTRPAAIAPSLHETGGVRFVAPIDPGAGGTWLATNEFGVTLCILNGAGAGKRREPVSRGLLVMELASSRSAASALERLRQSDLDQYAPFMLLAVERSGNSRVARWDGGLLSSGEPARPFLTSSSFDFDRVTGARTRRFEVLCNGRVPTLDLLQRFHAAHDESEGALGVCMHRPDAETVSWSRVDVDSTSARFLYSHASPCRALSPLSCSLIY